MLKNLEEDSEHSDQEDHLSKRNENDDVNPNKPKIMPNKVISNSAIQRFQELKRRREEMTTYSKWKLQKLDNKKIVKTCEKLCQVKSDVSSSAGNSSTSQDEEWKNLLKNYMDINAHLSGPVSHGEPKSGTEEKINEAVSKGNVEDAERLSDQLSTREFGVRVHEAFAAKRYAEMKKIEMETANRKKRRKPHWGFQTKQRWEMKGNM